MVSTAVRGAVVPAVIPLSPEIHTLSCCQQLRYLLSPCRFASILYTSIYMKRSFMQVKVARPPGAAIGLREFHALDDPQAGFTVL